MIVKNRVHSFFSLRNIENEFVDFKSYSLDRQFREIYTDLYVAFRRNDRVTLQRSLSESMNNHCVALVKSSKESPFLKQIDSMKNLQARIYHESDHLLPEEQWAQITIYL